MQKAIINLSDSTVHARCTRMESVFGPFSFFFLVLIFLYYTYICISMSEAWMGNQSRELCWPWRASSRNTLSLIQLTYSALHPMNGHCHSSSKMSHCWGKGTFTSTYSTQRFVSTQTNRPQRYAFMSVHTFVAAYAKTCTHIKRQGEWWIFMDT